MNEGDWSWWGGGEGVKGGDPAVRQPHERRPSGPCQATIPQQMVLLFRLVTLWTVMKANLSAPLPP